MKFFRIITEDITSKSYLRLPDKFVEKHGVNMPKTVSLRVPTGAKWSVEVKEMENGLWLGKGLFEFAESLGVKYGHFLIFDYVANNDNDVFDVVVIDMSASEIQYPAALSNIVDMEDQGGSAIASKCPKLELVEYDANLGMCESRSNGADPAQSRQCPRKTAKGSEFGLGIDQVTTTKGQFGREVIRDREGRTQCVIQGRRCNETIAEEAIARAKAFVVKEPVCIIALRPSYVGEQSNDYTYTPLKCQMLFPVCFVKEYFNLSNKYVTLQTIDGQTWSIEYRLAALKQCFFTNGWRQFVKENRLQSGDVCLFQLIKGAENALKVVIFYPTDHDQAPQ